MVDPRNLGREALLAENTEMRQVIQAQQQLLHQRSEPLMTAVLDALINLTRAAQAGSPEARRLVSAWVLAQEGAAAAHHGLSVVHSNGGLGRD